MYINGPSLCWQWFDWHKEATACHRPAPPLSLRGDVKHSTHSGVIDDTGAIKFDMSFLA